MNDLITQIINYPLAETIHSFQGIIAGWLLCHGLLRDKTSYVLGAFVVAYCFIAYEDTEMARIHDQGDSDIMVFWGTAMVTALFYDIIHYFRHHIFSSLRFVGNRIKDALRR